jgi:Ca2+-binding RTX toxin-like protein
MATVTVVNAALVPDLRIAPLFEDVIQPAVVNVPWMVSFLAAGKVWQFYGDDLGYSGGVGAGTVTRVSVCVGTDYLHSPLAVSLTDIAVSFASLVAAWRDGDLAALAELFYSGDDLVRFSGADGWIETGGGNASVEGGPGHSTVFGDAGGDTILAGTGNDELHGGIGNDSLAGEGGPHAIWAGADEDALVGGPGHDRLYGEDGADRLSGGWCGPAARRPRRRHPVRVGGR